MNIAELFAKLSLKADKASFAAADRLLSGVKKALVGIVAFQTVRWFGSLISDTAELAGRLVETSQKTGLLIENLQELEFAGQQSGIGTEGMATGLKFLSRNIEAALSGNKKLSQTFRELRVNLKDSQGNIIGADEALLELADRFSTMPNGVQKSALAMQIFGRSGQEMIPLLNEGRKGIERLRGEFRQLGAGLTTEQAVALEAWGDEVDKIKVSLAGFRNQLIVALFPALKTVVATILSWVKANREVIASKIREWATNFIQMMKDLWPTLVRITNILIRVGKVGVQAFKTIQPVLKVVVTVLNFFAEAILRAMENTDRFHVILGTLVAVFLVVKAAAIGAGIAAAAAWVAAAAPFVALAAAIAAVIIVIRDLWRWIQGGESVIKNVHTWLVDLFVEAIEFWVKQFKAFFQWIEDQILAIPRAIRDAFNKAKDFAQDVFGDISPELKEIARRAQVPATTGSATVAPAPGAAVSVESPQFHANITVTAGPGADGNQIGLDITRQINQLWGSKMIRAGSSTVRRRTR